ncbi:hypothetical protein [Methylobacterium oryzihabitans]|uniref:Uncharacterized protein n=1 Tax=Methylobacterium oryzihabitans TaxID=2499852 RepID=A0A437NT49_9HYPH|nr:hypothetical protein [Methylobacterium oryzihabitans]RVU13199.1 hypothetical protein EOE48_26885 [Methylobacterium oryzihabitans]
MSTQRHTLRADAWTDAGPTPCFVQLIGSYPAAYVIDTQPPDSAEEGGHVLSRSERPTEHIPLAGARLYLRALPLLAGALLSGISTVVAVSHAARGDDWASPPVDWQPIGVAAIAAADVYQTLFPAGAAMHGGTIVNLSPPGTPPLWVDPTGATGAIRSAGAMPVFPAFDAAGAPGSWRVPPTRRAVTIMGPASATFGAFSG